MEPTSTPAASLSRKATSGALWSGMAQVGRQVLSLVSVGVLSRHISEAEYGLMGMAITLTNFLETFRDLGTSAAVVREPQLTPRLISSIFWLNILAGVGMMLGVLLLAYPTSWFFEEPQLVPVLRVVSLTFFLMATSVLPYSLLTREMAFRDIQAASLIGSLCGTATAVTLALQGKGVWSLVFGSLVNAAINSLVLWIRTPWRVQWTFDWAEVKRIFGFSMNLSGFNMLNYFSRNADNVLVGKFLGKAPLGIYQMAYTIMVYPLTNISHLIGQVVFPAIAQVQNDHKRFRDAFCRMCMLISTATFPAMLGITAVAGPFVAVVLGPDWSEVAGLLQIFGPLGMAQSVYTSTGLIFIAQGRTDIQFRWGIISGICYVASFWFGLRWGVLGVALCYAVVWAVLSIPGMLLPFRLIGLPMSEFLASLWPSFKCSALMAAVCLLWQYALRTMFGVTNDLVLLVSTISVGVLSYLGLTLLTKHPAIAELAMLAGQYQHPMALRISRKLYSLGA